jgi:O-antigen ligase
MSSVPIVLQPQQHVLLDWQSAAFFVLLFLLTAFATSLRSGFGLVVLCLVDPFAVYRFAGVTTVTAPKVALLAVAAGLLLPGLQSYRLRDRRILPIIVSAIAVVCVTAITIVSAKYHAEAIREILKSLEYLAFFLIGLFAFASNRDEALLQWSLTLSSLLVAVVAILEDYTVAPASIVLGGVLLPRIAGPLEGPNQLAGYLELILPVLLALRLKRGPNLALDLALVTGVFGSILTFSRGGLVGTLIGIGFVALARARPRWKTGLVLGTVAVALAFALTFGTAVITGTTAKLATAPFIWHSSDVSTGGDTAGGFSGLGTRTELWRAAWSMWRAHPIIGVGAGNYELEIGEVGPAGVRTHANSFYFQSLAEGGVILLATYLVFLGLVLTSLARYGRSPISIGVLGATLAIAAHQVVDDLLFFPKVGDMWWLLLGIAAATIVLERPAET